LQYFFGFIDIRFGWLFENTASEGWGLNFVWRLAVSERQSKVDDSVAINLSTIEY
jgi:hypothetical protein